MKSAAVFAIADRWLEFLPIWLRYYGERIGAPDVYLLVPPETRRLRLTLDRLAEHHAFHRLPIGHVTDESRQRLAALFQRFLLHSYASTLCVELDEIVAPLDGGDLRRHLEAAPPVLLLRGYEVVRTPDEEPINVFQPLLPQRSSWCWSADASKPAAAKMPLTWVDDFAACEELAVEKCDENLSGQLLLVRLRRIDECMVASDPPSLPIPTAAKWLV